MLKNILKKSFVDISASYMIILVSFIFVSFYPHIMNYTSEQRLFFYDLLVRGILGLAVFTVLAVLASNIITQLRLFSSKKILQNVIRIVIFACLAFSIELIIFYPLFSFLSQSFILNGLIIIVSIGIIFMIIGLVIEDKMRKKDVEIINKRLSELREEK